jgi:hypothetical protein
LPLDVPPFFAAVRSDGGTHFTDFEIFARCLADSAVLDDRPICVGERGMFAAGRSAILNPLVIVDHFARNDTTAAANALGQINEYAFRFTLRPRKFHDKVKSR